MGSKATKVKRELEVVQLGAFFRELADAFDGRNGAFDAGAGGDLRDFYKLEIKMKRQMAAVTLKMKFEQEEKSHASHAGDDVPAGGQGRPKYKKFKKQMQASCAGIEKSLSDNTLPDPLNVQRFLEDARIMVSYPGYGDAYYEPFSQACQGFSLAFERQDLASVRDAFGDIVRLKEDCHDRYK